MGSKVLRSFRSLDLSLSFFRFKIKNLLPLLPILPMEVLHEYE
jgi:hypothetical protein